MSGRRKIIDISTKEKKEAVLDIFNHLTSKNKAHEYFGISDNSSGSKYLREIAEKVGFDLDSYKKKEIKYCKMCGREIISKVAKKFCSKSCAASYNNKFRKRKPKKEKEGYKSNDKFCVGCGKKLTNRQTKFCSKKCKDKTHYVSGELNLICKTCGNVFKSTTQQRQFCCRDCADKYKSISLIKDWIEGSKKLNPNSTIPDTIRKFLFEQAHYKCEQCGFEGYNVKTGRTILQIHHIDGNSSNNNKENLQVLCPNCHAMTENFMGLNKGKSARNKRYKNKKVLDLIL